MTEEHVAAQLVRERLLEMGDYSSTHILYHTHRCGLNGSSQAVYHTDHCIGPEVRHGVEGIAREGPTQLDKHDLWTVGIPSNCIEEVYPK